MIKRVVLCAVVAMSLLSGCGMYKKYETADSAPEHLFGRGADTLFAEIDSSAMAEGMTKDSGTIGYMKWRDIFRDPRLQHLIQHALSNNTDMKAAKLRIGECAVRLKSAKLGYLPSLSFGPKVSVSKIMGDGIDAVSKGFDVGLSADWEIETFGRITNNKRKAEASLRRSGAEAQMVQTEIVAGVANLYYTLLMLDAQLDIAIATNEAWAKSVETAKAMKAAGMVNEAAVSQYVANSCGIAMTVIDLAQQIREVENALCTLMNRTPGRIMRGSIDEQEFPESFTIGLPVSLLSNRPDVKAAEEALAEAYYNTKIAKSAFYPSLRLSGTVGWTNNNGAIASPGGVIASALAGLTQPIFARGEIKANYKVSEAEEEIARLNFEHTLVKAGGEVNNALTQYQTAKSKKELYEAQVEALARAMESTELLMKHGSTTYLEVLTAQQSYLNASLGEVANKYEEIRSLVAVYKALGGGKE